MSITIIGTSHIAKQSMKEVEEFILNEKPDIIAIELDYKRLYALTHPKQKGRPYNLFRIGISGFLFSMLGAWVEKKLGEAVGVSPGSEMIKAVRLAKKNRIELALIDQDIEITLKRLSLTLTWKEKLSFIRDIVKAIIFRKNELEGLGIKNIDLTKVPEKRMIKLLLKKVRERYPNLYNSLIHERNIVMANKLSMLSAKDTEKKILAIVGAGHEDELRSMTSKNNTTYTFSITQ